LGAAEGPASVKNLDNLRQAQQEIERTLRELQNSRF